MLNQLLGGLCTGPQWNFVIWVVSNGLALIVHREWTRLTKKPGAASAASSRSSPCRSLLLGLHT